MGRSVEEHILLLKDRMSPGLNKVNKNINNMRGNIQKSQRAFSGFGSSAVRVLGTIATAAAVIDIAKVTADFESLQTTIKFLSGTTKEYGVNTQFLEGISEHLGISLLDTTKGFRTLAAGMVGTGIEGKVLRDIFEGVAVGLRATGATSDQMQGALLALGQIASKGTVQAEELRGQLGERLPGAFAIAAKAMGVTQKRLNKMLELGLVPAKEFLPRFANEIKKTFQDAIPEAVKTANANFARLSTTLLKIKLRIGRDLVPVILRMINIFKNKLIPWVKKNMVLLKRLGIIIGSLIIGIKAWGIAQGILNVIMTANPVGLIIVGIVALIALITVIITKYDEWGAGLSIVAGLMSPILVPLLMMVNLVQSFRRHWDEIQNIFEKQGMKKGILAIGLTLADSILLPLQQLLEIAAGFGSDRAARFAKKIQGLRDRTGLSFADPKKTTEGGGPASDPFSLSALREFLPFIGGKGGKGGKGGGKSGLGSGIATVSSRAPQSINISIGSLVEELVFKTQNLTESASMTKDIITRHLLDALNDAQVISR